MTYGEFEFKKQAPIGAINLDTFISENKDSFNESEDVSVVFVETGIPEKDGYKTLYVTLSFINPELANPLMTFPLKGLHIHGSYTDIVKFIHGDALNDKDIKIAYQFMQTLLSKDESKTINGYPTIQLDLINLDDYLRNKKFTLNGDELANGKLIVNEMI